MGIVAKVRVQERSSATGPPQAESVRTERDEREPITPLFAAPPVQTGTRAAHPASAMRTPGFAISALRASSDHFPSGARPRERGTGL